jgi:hypothetical protein
VTVKKLIKTSKIKDFKIKISKETIETIKTIK